ncbi:MAG: nucleotidyltransferase [Firmicutes bacterium]|nr:nucleotidyltransferase [Bacillota bacterium]
MKVSAIVAEYNPFHNGHKFHIEETKRRTGCDCVVAVMSGNFVQRGEPALFNKWHRAEAAVRSGVDLVIELPAAYSCAGAEFFAKGAVRILNRLGCVDHLSFGAEETSLDTLKNIAGMLAFEGKEISDSIKKYMNEGISYAAARSKAVAGSGPAGYAEIISKPNNILAVEYLKQLILSGSSIEPLVIERKHAGYYEESPEESFAGAGKLRDILRDSGEIESILDYIPDECFELYKDKHMCFSEDMFELIVYKIISESPERLAEIDSVVEGLENRAGKAVMEAIDQESLIDLIKSKRYSRTSIQRMLVRILLGIKSSDMEAFEECEASYARVLAFSEAGARLIRKLKKQDELKAQIITNINREKIEDPVLNRMLRLDILASDIYDLICYSKTGVHSDHRMKPFKK